MPTERKAKSPYQKYKKVPHRYGEEIRACIKACRENKVADYRRAADAFSARYRGEFVAWRLAQGHDVQGLRPAA